MFYGSCCHAQYGKSSSLEEVRRSGLYTYGIIQNIYTVMHKLFDNFEYIHSYGVKDLYIAEKPHKNMLIFVISGILLTYI